MTPPAGASARRSTARVQPRPAPAGPRRPPLRIFQPAPRRRPAIRLVRRPTMWISGVFVVGSLLAVVAGDALMTEGQIRLSTTQHQAAAAVATQRAYQTTVAQMAAPTRVVYQAESQLGLVAPGQVIELPQVPLDVPLPAPQTAPLPTAHASASAAKPPASATTPATTPATR